MPAISVIIPIYNVEKYLRRCLDSVLNQTFTDWQAICVNDGSPDNSAAILSEYAARDSRFKIVNKKNGGLSDARNAGMQHATDRIYRPQLMVRHILKMDTDNVVPMRMHKKYDPAQVKTLLTNDIYAYATERAHNMFNPRRRWLVKHCQVWKNLYRRDLISDTSFIKGILFEDFPWWSAIMLKNPRVTIAPLPLYFYVPNFGGIVLSAKQLRILHSLCDGITDAYTRYKKNANEYQMRKWNKNFKWYFIKWAFRKIKYMDNRADMDAARARFVELEKIGALDNPPTCWARRLRCKICKFIKVCDK